MLTYYIFSTIIIVWQVLILIEAYRHLIFTIRKYRPKPFLYTPPAAIIAPCKGLETTFEKNMLSFLRQDYPHYEVFFVVESEDDPACIALREIIQKHHASSSPVKAHLIIAGKAKNRGQKVHNLITAVDATGPHVEVIAFVDSDACLKPQWLGSMVHPLRRKDIGASTGYRWFVPTDSRLSTYVLSAANGMIASMLGPHHWNAAWGGGMAIPKKYFFDWGVRKIWDRSCLDDYTLTRQVKRAGRTVAFVPPCFVASYDQMSWGQFWAFARRQFIFTWAYHPKLWWVALAGFTQFLAGFWVGAIVTLSLWLNHSNQTAVAALLPIFVYAASILKAAARQIMICKILPEDRKKLLIPALIDVFCQPITTLFLLACLLSSAGNKTLIWRGYRYNLADPDCVEISPLT